MCHLGVVEVSKLSERYADILGALHVQQDHLVKGLKGLGFRVEGMAGSPGLGFKV